MTGSMPVTFHIEIGDRTQDRPVDVEEGVPEVVEILENVLDRYREMPLFYFDQHRR